MELIDFDSLYKKYSQDLYRFALYLCADPAVAEDIAEETFVRVWLAPGEIRVRTVKSYLYMTARNLYRLGLRHSKRRAELDEQMPAPGPGPEHCADSRLQFEALLKALQTLPEADRAALLMHAQDGLPYEEISAILGISISAARVKVHRSRVRLARLCHRER